MPRKGPGGGPLRGLGQLRPRALVTDQLGKRVPQRPRVLGGHEPCGALRRQLGKAADGAQHHRLSEGEARVEDARVLGVPVGQGKDIGAAEDRGDLGVLHEAGQETDSPRRLGGKIAERRDVEPRIADDPELRSLDAGEGAQQGVDPLVGAQQAEEEDHRPLCPLELARQRLRVGDRGQVVEGAVGNHPHASGVEADLVAQARGAVLGVGDHSIHAIEDTASSAELAPARPRGRYVVGGHHPGPVRREQQGVERGNREPLVVDDVGIDCAAEAQHVGQVLDELEGAASGGVEAAGGTAAVEALIDPVTVGGWHRAVEEVAGQQLDVCSGAGQRRRQGAVIGRREGRGVDQLHSHWVGHARTIIVTAVAPTLSYCIVNTNGREHLLACLDAIERTAPAGVPSEILVLDNASEDGSADAVRNRGGEIRLIALEQRVGKAENDSTLLREASGRYCLLLNEDSELRAGAPAALIGALEAAPRAGAAGAQLLDSAGRPVPCAWRFPGVGTALLGALFLHRRFTVQSGGDEVAAVDWAQSSALMVRREAAAEVGYLDPDFFVYYDECDFAKRLADAGWQTLLVPTAEAVHHDQLSTDLSAGLPRIVEFHRNRDLYMRKHHSRAAAFAVRLLTAWAYALRSLAATAMPNRDARVLWAHARQALFPNRGESLRDRASAGRPRP